MKPVFDALAHAIASGGCHRARSCLFGILLALAWCSSPESSCCHVVGLAVWIVGHAAISSAPLPADPAACPCFAVASLPALLLGLVEARTSPAPGRRLAKGWAIRWGWTLYVSKAWLNQASLLLTAVRVAATSAMLIPAADHADSTS